MCRYIYTVCVSLKRKWKLKTWIAQKTRKHWENANLRQAVSLNWVRSLISCQSHFYQIAIFGEVVLKPRPSYYRWKIYTTCIWLWTLILTSEKLIVKLSVPNFMKLRYATALVKVQKKTWLCTFFCFDSYVFSNIAVMAFCQIVYRLWCR